MDSAQKPYNALPYRISAMSSCKIVHPTICKDALHIHRLLTLIIGGPTSEKSGWYCYAKTPQNIKIHFARFDWIKFTQIEMAVLNLTPFWENSDTKRTLSSSIPTDVASQECILGIDEAGRGPVLGDVILLRNIT